MTLTGSSRPAPDTTTADTTAETTPDTPPSSAAFRRAGSAALIAGGVLFAVGNALHPLEHSDAAAASPTWATAHLTFALGALLITGGLGVLARRLAASRVGIAGLVLTAVGMVFVVGSAYVEVYVAPVVGHATMERIEAGAAAWGLLTLLTFVLGPVLVAVAGLWHRALPVAACAGILVAQVATLVGPALPVAEGWTIIPATVVLGLSIAGLGLTVRADG